MFKNIEEYKAYEERKAERKKAAELKVADIIANNRNIELFGNLQCYSCMLFTICHDQAIKEGIKGVSLKDASSSVCRFIENSSNYIYEVRHGSPATGLRNNRSLAFRYHHLENDIDKIRDKVYTAMNIRKIMAEYYSTEEVLKNIEAAHE